MLFFGIVGTENLLKRFKSLKSNEEAKDDGVLPFEILSSSNFEQVILF